MSLSWMMRRASDTAHQRADLARDALAVASSREDRHLRGVPPESTQSDFYR
jgi:hypothetical protein